MMHDERMDMYRSMVNDRLERALPYGDKIQNRLLESMRYSLLAGGKRIRPVLLLEFFRILGGDPKEALPFACAMEMVHTYSLIHDDMPCMDDDETRRGKPANHVEYGEATALLAGSSLLSAAFEIMLTGPEICKISPDRIIRASHALARASGVNGMAGGQALDMDHANLSHDYATVSLIHALKTGALIEAASEMGCILGGSDENQMLGAIAYASRIGMVFQIIDDILDVEGSSERLGKNAGKDQSVDKMTFVQILGLEESRAMAKKMTEEAIQGLSVFSERAFLTWLAQKLLNREN